MFPTLQKGLVFPVSIPVMKELCTGFFWILVMLPIQEGMGQEEAQRHFWSHGGKNPALGCSPAFTGL